MSLRRRVTLLAATCVAGTVALVSFGAYWTMRADLYETLDEELIERAEDAVQSPPLTNRVEQTHASFLASADIDIGVLALAGRPGAAALRRPDSLAPA